MKKVAIEKGLDNVARHLINQGHQVVMLSGSIDENMKNLNSYDCIVTSGLNKDALGISETLTEAPVINANGMSPEEVAERLNSFQ
ncbi:YkuS family protein [Tissierella sp. Yu-01]|uniref:YkuS family protein n=1 Tax=Tissierella sp. Yu-01 TaxID=3035694 RepID=UPI00240D4580|nr:YkuS family protein [Tissierella sp. Yu-01]WFA08265.1 YkuS family protein [Tissierella sp. Yu-01]